MFENEMNLDFDLDGATVTQESYDAASSSYKDLFEEKFTSFNPESIISGGNNKLKSGQFDMDIEDSDLAIGYVQPTPATTPKPGRFM
jgi:hypothetical protein